MYLRRIYTYVYVSIWINGCMYVCMHVRGFVVMTFNTVTKSDFNLEHFLPAPRLGHRGNSGLFLFRSPALCFRLFRQGNYVFFDFLVLGLHGLGLVEQPRGPWGGPGGILGGPGGAPGRSPGGGSGEGLGGGFRDGFGDGFGVHYFGGLDFSSGNSEAT